MLSVPGHHGLHKHQTLEGWDTVVATVNEGGPNLNLMSLKFGPQADE